MRGEIFFDYGFMSENGRAVPDGPCTDSECDRYRRLAGVAEGSLGVVEHLVGIVSAPAGERASLEEGTRRLQEERAALAGDNERLFRTNKRLNARKTTTESGSSPVRTEPARGDRAGDPGANQTSPAGQSG